MTTQQIMTIAIAIGSLMLNLYQYLTKEKRGQTEASTKLGTELQFMSTLLGEIKADIKHLQQRMSADHDDLVKLNASVVQAWKAIEDLRDSLASK